MLKLSALVIAGFLGNGVSYAHETASAVSEPAYTRASVKLIQDNVLPIIFNTAASCAYRGWDQSGAGYNVYDCATSNAAQWARIQIRHEWILISFDAASEAIIKGSGRGASQAFQDLIADEMRTVVRTHLTSLSVKGDRYFLIRATRVGNFPSSIYSDYYESSGGRFDDFPFEASLEINRGFEIIRVNLKAIG